jgi:hypothetical protein
MLDNCILSQRNDLNPLIEQFNQAAKERHQPFKDSEHFFPIPTHTRASFEQVSDRLLVNKVIEAMGGRLTVETPNRIRYKDCKGVALVSLGPNFHTIFSYKEYKLRNPHVATHHKVWKETLERMSAKQQQNKLFAEEENVYDLVQFHSVEMMGVTVDRCLTWLIHGAIFSDIGGFSNDSHKERFAYRNGDDNPRPSQRRRLN